MYELTKEIQDEVCSCILFTDDNVVINETREGLNSKLEFWRHTLEFGILN